jgi:hypothetical protein
MTTQNLTEHMVSTVVPPESDYRLDQELVGWFALLGGGWSGTATELFATLKTTVAGSSDLWPQSPRALYAHIESHRQVLRSLGVDVLLRPGYPRMISLRSCQNGRATRKPPSCLSEINRAADPAISLPRLADDQKTRPADSGEANPEANETFSQDTPVARSDLAQRFANGDYADGANFKENVFENTAEALVAIAEMGGQIREQDLDLKSAIDLVVGRTHEITRSSGVAIELLQHGSIVYTARAGVVATMAGLHFQGNLLQSCLKTGKALPLPDAHTDPLVGPTCRRAGISSLIIVPILHDRELAGTIELLFKEERSFSTRDVMTLDLIADTVSERLSGAAQIDLTQAERRRWPAKPRVVENIGPQLGHSLNATVGVVDALPSPSADTTNAETRLRTLATPESSRSNTISELVAASTPLWLALKRAWMRSTRAM